MNTASDENDVNKHGHHNPITWNHILNATKQQLYPAMSESMREIIENKENEIKKNDVSQDAMNKVLNILSDKNKSMSQEEYLYLKQLFQKSATFQHLSTGK